MVDGRSKLIAARFQGEQEVDRDIAALGYHALLLGSFALLCQGLLPPAVFMVLGLCAYIRNFNAIHEGSHARKAAWNPLRPLRQAAMIVHGPLQLGRRELSKNHRMHHAFTGDPLRDPDATVTNGPWWRAAAAAFLQPELTAVAFVRREGAIDATLRRTLSYNAAVSAGLLALAGADIVWWIAVTRLGSTTCWFIFDWALHHPRVYGRGELPLPRALQYLWIVMFSRNNLLAVQHHALHHRYSFVADRELPALAHLLAGEPGIMADAHAHG